MKAYIRDALKGETSWWRPALVCDFGTEARLFFEKNNGKLTDKRTGKIYAPEAKWTKLLYKINQTHELLVEGSRVTWQFNGSYVKEEWPTTKRRIIRCDPFIYYVKPEDDSLSFDIEEDDSDLIKAIIAFYLKTLTKSE